MEKSPPSAAGVAVLVFSHPAGMQAISRGLSEAIPPEACGNLERPRHRGRSPGPKSRNSRLCSTANSSHRSTHSGRGGFPPGQLPEPQGLAPRPGCTGFGTYLPVVSSVVYRLNHRLIASYPPGSTFSSSGVPLGGMNGSLENTVFTGTAGARRLQTLGDGLVPPRAPESLNGDGEAPPSRFSCYVAPLEGACRVLAKMQFW
jgi:hypothetical protein